MAQPPRRLRLRAVASAAALAGLLAGCSDGVGGSDAEVTALQLRTGQCFNAPDEPRRLDEVDTVPCAEPHENEVFATFEHPGGPDVAYPGEDEIAAFAESGCADRFEGYVGAPQAGSGLAVGTVFPREESWEEAGDRQVACVLRPGERVTGSRKGTG